MIKGTHHTEETKRKLSAINTGKKATAETKRKMSKSMIGHYHTKETKQKISFANKGQKNALYGKYWVKNPNFSTGTGAYVREFQRRGNEPVCSDCGKQGRFAINSIHIHHKDGDRKNNSMDNLQSLCSMCHLHIHKNWEKVKS